MIKATIIVWFVLFVVGAIFKIMVAGANDADKLLIMLGQPPKRVSVVAAIITLLFVAAVILTILTIIFL